MRYLYLLRFGVYGGGRSGSISLQIFAAYAVFFNTLHSKTANLEMRKLLLPERHAIHTVLVIRMPITSTSCIVLNQNPKLLLGETRTTRLVLITESR